jgi:nucleotide-binding universal stress UspA family protein
MTTYIILAPLDGSTTAEAVRPFAVALARRLGQRLILLRVYDAPPTLVPEEEQARRSEAETYLHRVAEELRTEGLEVQTRVAGLDEDAEIGEEIARQARLTGASLIAIATHGRTGPKRWALGSVTDEVVRSAACPVLVVRAYGSGAAAGEPAFRRVLVPLDGSATAEAALDEAIVLARQLGATLDLVQVVPLPWAVYGPAVEVWVRDDIDGLLAQGADDYLAQVQQRIPETVATERHVLRGAPGPSILDHAERTNADLIVMGTHGRSGVSRLILGSVADQVVRAGKSPVLLVRHTGSETESGGTPAGAGSVEAGQPE